LLFLLNEKLVRYVKIVDKVTPIMAYLHPLHMTCFQSSLVEFQQADLTKSDHLDRIFQNHSFDFVFNLASETRSGQPEHVYSSRCSDLSYLCAEKSAESGVKRFIEVLPLSRLSMNSFLGLVCICLRQLKSAMYRKLTS
jgi:UDP-glucose 4-epimerase